MTDSRKPYPSDVSDDEWTLVAPYLTLMEECAPQRQYPLRELFNGLRYVIRYGIAWRAMPNDLPPWSAVYQQSQRWLAAGCFESLAQDLRAVLRMAAGRDADPRRRLLIAEPSDLRRKAAIARDMMARNASVVLNFTSPLILLGIYWPSMSRQRA